MRNLILAAAITLLSDPYAYGQSLKVAGFTGDPYNFITQFDGTCFTVLRNDGYAVIGLDGKEMATGIKKPVDRLSRQIHLYHNTLFAQDGNNIELKDAHGQPLGTGQYMDVLPFRTDNTVVRISTPMLVWNIAYLDTTGKEILQFDVRKYLSLVDPPGSSDSLALITLSDFLPFSECLTPIKSQLTGKRGYINKKMELVIPVGFKNAQPFSEGLAAVQNEDGNWGFIDRNGKLVIPYTHCLPPSPFMSGLAKVENTDGKVGFINKNNVLVIPPKFMYASSFYRGYTLVRERLDSPIYMVDTAGAVVATFPKEILYIDNSKPHVGLTGNIEPEYLFTISPTLQQLVEEGKGIFQKGASYGLMDNRGNVALDFNYQYLTDYHHGKMVAYFSTFTNGSTHNESGILDDKGNWVVQIVP